LVLKQPMNVVSLFGILAASALLWSTLSGIGAETASAAQDLTSTAQGSNSPGPEPFLQQELKQQQIRATTQRVGDQLASIIAEFDRNGIGGDDGQGLRAIHGEAGTLTR